MLASVFFAIDLHILSNNDTNAIVNQIISRHIGEYAFFTKQSVDNSIVTAQTDNQLSLSYNCIGFDIK